MNCLRELLNVEAGLHELMNKEGLSDETRMLLRAAHGSVVEALVHNAYPACLENGEYRMEIGDEAVSCLLSDVEKTKAACVKKEALPEEGKNFFAEHNEKRKKGEHAEENSEQEGKDRSAVFAEHAEKRKQTGTDTDKGGNEPEEPYGETTLLREEEEEKPALFAEHDGKRKQKGYASKEDEAAPKDAVRLFPDRSRDGDTTVLSEDEQKLPERGSGNPSAKPFDDHMSLYDMTFEKGHLTAGCGGRTLYMTGLLVVPLELKEDGPVRIACWVDDATARSRVLVQAPDKSYVPIGRQGAYVFVAGRFEHGRFQLGLKLSGHSEKQDVRFRYTPEMKAEGKLGHVVIEDSDIPDVRLHVVPLSAENNKKTNTADVAFWVENGPNDPTVYGDTIDHSGTETTFLMENSKYTLTGLWKGDMLYTLLG